MPPRTRRASAKIEEQPDGVSSPAQSQKGVSDDTIDTPNEAEDYCIENCDSNISSLSYAPLYLNRVLSKFSDSTISIADAPRNHLYMLIVPTYISGAKGFSCKDRLPRVLGYFWLMWLIVTSIIVLFRLNQYYLDDDSCLPGMQSMGPHLRVMVAIAYFSVDVIYPLSFALVVDIHQKGEKYCHIFYIFCIILHCTYFSAKM